MTCERLSALGTDAERELLGAARGDAPPPRAKAELLAMLSAGAVLGSAAAAKAAGAQVLAQGTVGQGAAASAVGVGSVAAGTPGAATGGLGAVSGLAVAKWVGIGLLAGAPTTLLVATTTAPEAAEGHEPAPVALPAVVEAPLRPQPEDPFRAAAGDAPQLAVVAAAAASSRPRLTDEVAALDRVRAALGRGDASVAARALAEYRAAFPQGTLGPEAGVLEVQVALESGERERAAALARSFLARHAASPHAPRVRAFLARAASPHPAEAAARPAAIAPASRPPAKDAATPSSGAEDSATTLPPTPSVARFDD